MTDGDLIDRHQSLENAYLDVLSELFPDCIQDGTWEWIRLGVSVVAITVAGGLYGLTRQTFIGQCSLATPLIALYTCFMIWIGALSVMENRWSFRGRSPAGESGPYLLWFRYRMQSRWRTEARAVWMFQKRADSVLEHQSYATDLTKVMDENGEVLQEKIVQDVKRALGMTETTESPVVHRVQKA